MASSNIEFECPRCLKTVRARKEDAGKRVDCPECKTSLLVPAQSAAQDLFEDIFDSGPGPTEPNPAENPAATTKPKPPKPSRKSKAKKPEPEPKAKAKAKPTTNAKAAPEKRKAETIKPPPPEPTKASDLSSSPIPDFDSIEIDSIVEQAKQEAKTAADSMGSGKSIFDEPIEIDELANDDEPIELDEAMALEDFEIEETSSKPKPVFGRDGIEIDPSPDDVEPIPGDPFDPFQADPNAPIKVDGLNDDYDLEDVWGIKCRICDTRIHVNKDQVGTKVECPICYTSIKVTPVEKNPKSEQRWLQPKPEKSSIVEDDDAQKSEPADRTPEIPIDPTHGLAPVTEDLLAPKAPEPEEAEAAPQTSESQFSGYGPEDDEDNSEEARQDTDEVPVVDLFEDDLVLAPLEGAPDKKKSASKKPKKKSVDSDQGRSNKGRTQEKSGKKSRRELYEEAQKKKEVEETSIFALADPKPPKPVKTKTKSKPAGANQTENVKANELDQPASSPASSPAEEAQVRHDDFSTSALHQRAMEMLGSPGLFVRGIIASLLIGIGSAAMHGISGANVVERGAIEPTFAEKLATFGTWMLFGALPYMLGIAVLWATCSFVLREAAQGRRQIKSWKIRGANELLSTILFFGFSFFVAGVFIPPLKVLFFLQNPIRFLIGPALLLAAWFNKSAFQIVAVDAFQNLTKDFADWRAFYGYIFILAAIAMVASLLMMVNVFIVSAVTSIVGAVLLVFVTIAFAAATGWHCGRVVFKIEKGQ